MKKIEIVEIENSLFNFFTPAMILASGYFLINLISWPMSLLPWVTDQVKIGFDANVLILLLPIATSILVSVIVYFIFIPRLKVLDAEHMPLSKESLIKVLLLFCIAMSIRITYSTMLVEFLGATIELIMPWYLYSYDLLLGSPLYLVLFLIGRMVIFIFTELTYRRTAIPSLEDRGMGPIHAIIISGAGFVLLDLSYYLSTPNLLSNIFWIGSTIIFAISTGVIYVLTRNVIYCWLYAVVYDFYKLTNILGEHLNDGVLKSIHSTINVVSIAIGLVVITYIIFTVIISRSQSAADWIKALRKPSAPHIGRGVFGFLLIAIGLIFGQYLITTWITGVTQFRFPDYIVYHTLFFLIAFSVPFWLSITTEYARN